MFTVTLVPLTVYHNITNKIMAQGMLLKFSDDEYEKIPSPKRTWVMEVLRTELSKIEKNPFGALIKRFSFLAGGKYYEAKGSNQMDAFLSLGFTQEQAFDRNFLTRFGTVEEAKRDGWSVTWGASPAVTDEGGLLDG